MNKNYKWKVQVSFRHSELATGSNALAAKAKAWANIKDGYTYGHKNWRQFMKNTVAIRLN